MRNIQIFKNQDDLAAAAAELFFSAGRKIMAKQARFTVCLSGGSTPRAIHQRLTEHPDFTDFPWARTHFFWGDERCVAPAHPDSNFGMARDSILHRIPAEFLHVHRIRGELPPVEAARLYEDELRSFFAPSLTPVFDLLFLGLGTDAHIASIFPGTDAVTEKNRLVLGHFVECQNSWRITLTPPILTAAERIVMLVTGANKAAAVRQALQAPAAAELYPVHVLRSNSKVTWLIDKEAASELKSAQH